MGLERQPTWPVQKSRVGQPNPFATLPPPLAPSFLAPPALRPSHPSGTHFLRREHEAHQAVGNPRRRPSGRLAWHKQGLTDPSQTNLDQGKQHVTNYCGWTKSISHHVESMVETIVCWYLQGHHHSRVDSTCICKRHGSAPNLRQAIHWSNLALSGSPLTVRLTRHIRACVFCHNLVSTSESTGLALNIRENDGPSPSMHFARKLETVLHSFGPHSFGGSKLGNSSLGLPCTSQATGTQNGGSTCLAPFLVRTPLLVALKWNPKRNPF